MTSQRFPSFVFVLATTIFIFAGCASTQDNKSVVDANARFKAADKDGDGRVSLQEWYDYGGDRLAFVAASREHEGYLNPKEFFAASWHQGAAAYDMEQSVTQTDAELTSSVRDALGASSKVNADQIKVEVYQRVVQLSGGVGSEEEKAVAESIASGVPAVKSVFNQITVRK